MNMKKLVRSFLLLILVAVACLGCVFAVNQDTPETVEDSAAAATTETAQDNSTSAKAMAAAIAIGLTGLGGTLAMGMAISKSADGISRQPEAEGHIRTTMMLGLVFVETVVIYALVVAILVIFVL